MLKVTYNNSQAHPLWIIHAENTIGGLYNCNIQINSSNNPQHDASIIIENDMAYIVRKSDAIIHLNQSIVQHKELIQHGDSLSIGDEILTIEDPSQSIANLKKLAESIGSPSRHDANSSLWTIEGIDGNSLSYQFTITKEHVLGREQHCDFIIHDPVLSRKHARITLQNQHLLVEDLDSSNGTYINNVRVKAATKALPGDIITFEKLAFIVKGPIREINQTVVGNAINIDEIIKQAEQKKWQTKDSSIGNRHNTQMMDALKEEQTKEYRSMTLVGGIICGLLGIILIALVFAFL